MHCVFFSISFIKIVHFSIKREQRKKISCVDTAVHAWHKRVHYWKCCERNKRIEKKIRQANTGNTHTHQHYVETFIDFTLKLSANYFDVVSYHIFLLASIRGKTQSLGVAVVIVCAGEMSEFVRNEQSYTTHAYSVRCTTAFWVELEKVMLCARRTERERKRACEMGSWWKWENR